MHHYQFLQNLSHLKLKHWFRNRKNLHMALLQFLETGLQEFLAPQFWKWGPNTKAAHLLHHVEKGMPQLLPMALHYKHWGPLRHQAL
uniref:Uncharacterized protein n=1 Tax=Pyxicephalus adspersus TaxID=30357 RepID=A0AAV3B0G2_PYXAD|nr:TPA: hypothetical protein GDO54_000593 [Pyxicephalus adspersus]